MKNDLQEKLLSNVDKDDDHSGEEINFKKVFNNEYNNGARESEQYYLKHCISAEHLAQVFKADLVNGLKTTDKADLEWREKKWDNNHLPPEEENSILQHIIDCFEDPTLKVLVVAAIVSLIIGILKNGIRSGWIEGTAIASAVFIVVSISSYMNYNEKEQFLKLSRETKLKKVVVIRDGSEKEISLEDVLVGDILKIRIGDIINVDGVIYGDGKADMDESPVTGESDLMRKVPHFEFQLTTNIVAVFMTFLGGIILKDSPLNAIEMLWVNLIMDSFASLALATESPTNELLNRQPYKSNSNILTPMMTLTIIAQALFQIACLTVILFYGDVMFGVPSDRELEHFTWNNVKGYHFTIFFNIFVFMQVFNSINARKLNKTDYNVFKGILGNWYYIFIQSFIIVGQLIMVTF